MKTFTLYTLGCKVNQYETQQIQCLLEQSGFAAAQGQPADVVVVNTCCITHTAAAKSRHAIRRLCGQNPDAVVFIIGCLAADKTAELGHLPSRCVALADKEHLPAQLSRFFTTPDKQTPCGSKPSSDLEIKNKNGQNDFPDDNPAIKDIVLKEYKGQTRAFLKIQDGCDAYCTYCIIPKIRTQLTSKPADTVIQEAQRLVAAGHKEIVLTGIFLGAYGKSTARRKRQTDASEPLAELIDRLARLEGLQRLRLSSLEPADVTEPLLERFAKYRFLMPHFHLPLQSGSPRILKMMARQYTLEQYLDIIQRIRQVLDRPAITTDIIVGFPTETEQDFQQTCQVAQTVKFAKIHTFSFSPRQNTAAASLSPKTPPQVIAQRAECMKNLDLQLQRDFQRQFLGQPISVLVETTNPPAGRCERYFKVDLSSIATQRPICRGEIIPVILDEKMLVQNDQDD